MAAPEAEAEAGAREKEGCDGGAAEGVAASTEPAGSPLSDDAGQGAEGSPSDGAAAATAVPVPPESTPAAVSTAAEGQPGAAAAAVAGAPALSEGLAVHSPLQGEDGKAGAGENKEAVAAPSVAGTLASTAMKEKQQEEEEEEGSAYARASREFERLGVCTTPAEMLVVVKAGITSLCDDAARISVRSFFFLLLQPEMDRSGAR